MVFSKQFPAQVYVQYLDTDLFNTPLLLLINASLLTAKRVTRSRKYPYHPKDGQFQWEGESQKLNFFRESMKQNWNSRVGGLKTKKPSLGEGGGTNEFFLEPRNGKWTYT